MGFDVGFSLPPGGGKASLARLEIARRCRSRRRARGEYAVHAFDFGKAESYFRQGSAMWISPVCKTSVAYGPREAAVQSTKKNVDCLRCKAILAKREEALHRELETGRTT
jgi:hypothetical protein